MIYTKYQIIEEHIEIQELGEPNIYYNLIDEFENITGIPMLLNTSLNDNGKPIDGSPNDAINLLKNSNLDILVVGDNIYNK